MKIAITDANIFIDLIHIELHGELFAAGLEIHSTLNAGENIPPEIQRNRSLSPSDKSVFGLAMELDALILTGDGLLRKISGIRKIEVHGIIWLLDRFLEMELITKTKALSQLKHLMIYNKRLPTEDCERRISEWS